MTFFIGVHDLPDAALFENCMISVSRLKSRRGKSNWWRWLVWYWGSDRTKPFKPSRSGGKRAARKSPFPIKNWILDSGAFTSLVTTGTQMSIAEYVALIEYWWRNTHGNLIAVVTQDYLCLPLMLEITRQTVETHQRLTIYRYDAIKKLLLGRGIDVYLMPVLQGDTPADYVNHIRQWGARLKPGMWIGVGSIAVRTPQDVEKILLAIARELKAQGLESIRLHGFGLKKTALKNPIIDALIDTADSMSWKYGAERDRLKGQERQAAGVKYDREMKERSRQLVLLDLFV
jgi:hypothetical protein